MIYDQNKINKVNYKSEKKDLIKVVKTQIQEINKKLSKLDRDKFNMLHKYIWFQREAFTYETSKNNRHTWVDVVEVYSGIFNLYQKKIYLKWEFVERQENHDKLEQDFLEQNYTFSHNNNIQKMTLDSLKTLRYVLDDIYKQI